jgi:predicted dehydrogenase
MWFAGGVTGAFECGIATPETHLLEVTGDGGTLRLDDPWLGREQGVDAYALQLEDFAGAVRDGRPPLVSGEEIVRQAAAIDALMASAGI